MFALRGFAIAFSVFSLFYVALSLVVSTTWRTFVRSLHPHPAGRQANLLFLLRISPLVIALSVTVAFAVPSFLLLEPRAISEPLGIAPVVLGILGALLIAAGIFRATLSWTRARRAVSRWNRSRDFVPFSGPATVTRIFGTVPPLSTVGILRPRILLSQGIESQLTGSELRVTLQHEGAHVRRRDNLRKLLLRCAPFPRMSEFESTLFDAFEIAADNAAVSTRQEALDLAAAILKVSQSAALVPLPQLSTGLVHSQASILSARIERLLAWNESPREPRRTFSAIYVSIATIATLAGFTLTYTSLLVHIHTATEWLVH